MKDLPIIVLDFDSENHVSDFSDQSDEPLFVKIGMELCYQAGPALIKKIEERGHDIFLDLKLHSIPNTVQKVMEGLGELNVDLASVHTVGGTEMMKHAVKGLRKHNEITRIIAMTRLAPTTEEMLHQKQNIRTSIGEAALNYAKLAQESGLDDVVCSPSEAKLLTRSLDSELLKVMPGIRPKSTVVNDQKRITTPEGAKQLGSARIVVGCPITQNERPQGSYTKVEESWLG